MWKMGQIFAAISEYLNFKFHNHSLNNRSTSIKPGKLGKQIGDPEIKQFYREIRPGSRIDQQQQNRATSKNQLLTKMAQRPEVLKSTAQEIVRTISGPLEVNTIFFRYTLSSFLCSAIDGFKLNKKKKVYI